jgi:hypothetical protein
MSRSLPFPTPAEARANSKNSQAAQYAAVREKLFDAIESSEGEKFTFAVSLFGELLQVNIDRLLGEVRVAQWTCKRVSDAREGDYYEISPK